MIKLNILTALLCAGLMGCSEKKADTVTPAKPQATLNNGFAKGADISWVTEMEASNIRFFNNSGVEQDVFTILKSKGINAVRLRAWVNPADGWNNTTDVVNKAMRARAAGLRIMIDLHYSDTWADPANQNKPTEWRSLNFADLKLRLSTYTKQVMAALNDKDITPEWVQIGNETNDGMLWDDGKASVNMKNFAGLVQAGYEAVRSVSPGSKVVVHLSNGFDNELYRWMFDGLKANGAHWDVIGLSLYPSAANWQTLNTQCLSNMNDMVKRYGTGVMICEAGMPVTEAVAAKDFLTNLIDKVNQVAEAKGLGVFYWEPEAYNGWKGYTLGAFDDSGKPTIALDAFARK